MNISPSDSNNDDLFRKLRYYGEYIETKFRTGRAYDISPETVEQIIQVSIQLKEKPIDKNTREQLIELERICYAAMLYYREGRQPEEYFMRLNRISTFIHQIEN